MQIESTTTTKKTIKSDTYTSVMHNIDGNISAVFYKNKMNQQNISIASYDELVELISQLAELHKLWKQ